MKKALQYESLLLLLGDSLCFLIALPLALVVRDFAFPNPMHLFQYLTAFAPLVIPLLPIYFIVGLYDVRIYTVEPVSKLILQAIASWFVIAVCYFYLIPEGTLSPKITLLLTTCILYFLARLFRITMINHGVTRKKEAGILIGSGPDIEDLYATVNTKNRFPFRFSLLWDPTRPHSEPLPEASFYAVSLGDEKAREVMSENIKTASMRTIIDARLLCEQIFKRIPLSLINDEWILANISLSPKPFYDIVKRLIDLAIAIPLGVVSLIIFPFVWLAIKIDDKTPLPVIISQERIGTRGVVMKNYKFRSMTVNVSNKWVKEQGQVTRIGKVLRKTRIDELPQLWNVIRGDISLIGPRPDIIGLGETLQAQIPYYRFRTIIKPGLSGLAQITQKLPPQSIEETRLRLAYDLYYVKNRSIFLDLKIALRTVKTLLSRLGV